MSELVKRLWEISKVGPDESLPLHIQRWIPLLRATKLIQVCGHSDGDYIKITHKGRKLMEGAGHD